MDTENIINVLEGQIGLTVVHIDEHELIFLAPKSNEYITVKLSKDQSIKQIVTNVTKAMYL